MRWQAEIDRFFGNSRFERFFWPVWCVFIVIIVIDHWKYGGNWRHSGNWRHGYNNQVYLRGPGGFPVGFGWGQPGYGWFYRGNMTRREERVQRYWVTCFTFIFVLQAVTFLLDCVFQLLFNLKGNWIRIHQTVRRR